MVADFNFTANYADAHEGFLLSLMSNEIRYTIIATTYGIIMYAKNANIVKTGGHAS